jgi:hypothetical protein
MAREHYAIEALPLTQIDECIQPVEYERMVLGLRTAHQES